MQYTLLNLLSVASQAVVGTIACDEWSKLRWSAARSPNRTPGIGETSGGRTDRSRLIWRCLSHSSPFGWHKVIRGNAVVPHHSPTHAARVSLLSRCVVRVDYKVQYNNALHDRQTVQTTGLVVYSAVDDVVGLLPM